MGPAGRLIANALLCFTLCAQSLRVAPSETGRDTPGTFTVEIESPQARAPLALQWELSAPRAVAVKIADIRIGPAARSAHKTLTCAAVRETTSPPGGVRYRCILAGGQEPIGNGSLLEIQYRAQVDVQGAPIRITMDHIQGVAADLKAVRISDVYTILHIQ